MTEQQELARLLNTPTTRQLWEKWFNQNAADTSVSAIEMRAKLIGTIGREAELRKGCGEDYCELEEMNNGKDNYQGL